MSDTMRRPLRVFSSSCLVVAMFAHVPDAQACNSPSQMTLLWPRHDGTGSSSPTVPTNTELWLSTGTPEGVILEDGEGGLVPTTSRRMAYTSEHGIDSGFLILTPTRELSAATTYTVRLLQRGSDEPHEGPGSSWTFTTGDGPYSGRFPKNLDHDYVALEREEHFVEFCTDRSRDTVHVLRMSGFSSDAPFLHTFELAYPDGSKHMRHALWSDEFSSRAEHRVWLGESLGQSGYPCVSHTMTDVTGQTLRHDVGCVPSICVEPPPIGHESGDEARRVYNDFYSAPFGVWSQRQVSCGSFRLEVAEDDPGEADIGPPILDEGCATAPASPIPHAPLALGLALLGLLTRRRSEQ